MHTRMGGEREVGGYCRRYLGTRNRVNRRQKYRENRSLQMSEMTTIGALVHIDPTLRIQLNRVSNTPGNPGNLLEIYKVSWKFSGLVCEFAYLSLILVTTLVF